MTQRKRPEDKVKTGRPTKKTPENRQTILDAIGEGLSPDYAARIAHLSTETLRTWRQEDPEFSDAIETAVAEAVRKKVRYIEREAGHSWKAAAWLLERADPATFGKRINLGGADGGPLTIRVVYEDGQPEEGQE